MFRKMETREKETEEERIEERKPPRVEERARRKGKLVF